MNVSDKETSALSLYGQILWRRRYEFLASLGLVMLAMAFRTMQQPKIYESSLLLLLGNQQRPQVVTQQGQSEPPNDSTEIDTEIEILRTVPLVSQATKSLSISYPDLDAESIASELSIKQLGEGGVVSVTYRDTDPKRLVAVLSQLGETYVDFSLTNRRSQYTSAIQFIETKLPSAQQDLLQRSQQLSNFRKQHRLLDPTEVGTSLSEALADLNQQEYAAFTTLQQNLSLYNTLEKRLDFLPPEQALSIASLSQDPIYLESLKSYQEAETLYTVERARFTDAAPTVISLRAKRDELRQLLTEQSERILGKSLQSSNMRRFNDLQIAQVEKLLEAQNELRAQQAQLAALRTVRLDLEKDFKIVPDLQQEYDDLARQVQIASDNVTNLLSKLEEFRILEAQNSPIWKVVQLPDLPSRPVLPNLKLNLILGAVLGLILGAIVVYICEQLDRRLRHLESVHQVLDLPTLGIIPRINQSLLQLNSPASIDSTLQSQWLHLQATMQQLLFVLKSIGATESLKLIGFTSSASGDGKSTIVRHLGRCAAELNYRVLLIDGNLYQPELHLGCRGSNDQGLSDIICANVPWHEMIQSTGQPNLYLLAAGPTLSNPVAILDSAKFKQLMLDLRDHYDLILVDLPSAVGRPDAMITINYLDGFVFVVGLDSVTREMLQVGLDSLKYTAKQPLGMVCNMAKMSEITHTDVFAKNTMSQGKQIPFTQNQFVQKLMSPLLQRDN